MHPTPVITPNALFWETTMERTISRRSALGCAAWIGAGVVWTVSGGIPHSALIGTAEAATDTALRFVQISDCHIGFKHDPNNDTAGTLTEAIATVKRVKGDAKFMLHTGDVSHLSADAQFDTAAQIIGTSGLDTHYVPGEHDVLIDNGKGFFARFSPKSEPGGWYSFDDQGVHFVGLNNVQDLKAGGMGALGPAQLGWLKRDLTDLAASTPIVVFAHIPLWTVYEQWGWGTSDGAEALGMLKRFGSVTVLNGHIHQVVQKVEGNVAFHTARSTAFPQPAPGTAASPGPMNVPAETLRSVLGVATVSVVRGKEQLAIVDTTLVPASGA